MNEHVMTAPYLPHQELKNLCMRFAVEGDKGERPIQGLRLNRFHSPTAPAHTAYLPSFTLVIQGHKSLTLGTENYRYGEGQYLLTSLELPVVSWVVEASQTIPYFCLCLDLNMERLRALIERTGFSYGAKKPEDLRGLSINHASPDLIEAVTRLVRLLDQPDDIPAMAPLIEQEIYYRLLTGPEGPRLAHMAINESQGNKIARAVRWLRVNFHMPLKIEELAKTIGMSPSSFHQRFKEMTAMTPMQFQKKLRLHEAKRLMLIERLDAGNAGHRVGYQSPSQFSREYSRLYGVSPAKDTEARRENGQPEKS